MISFAIFIKGHNRANIAIFIEEDDKFSAECLLFCAERSALQAIFCFCVFFYNFAEYS